MAFSNSPFKDAIITPASQEIKPNLGTTPSVNVGSSGVEGVGSVSPAPLPENTVKFGTPSFSKGV